jgi:ATP-dependent Lon protease
MKKTEFYRLLAETAKKYPNLSGEIERLLESVQQSKEKTIDDDVLLVFWKDHLVSPDAFGITLSREKKPSGKVFQVHSPFSKEIKERLQLAERNLHYRNWANAVRAIPDSTSPLPEVDKQFVQDAKKIWEENIYGNEDILKVILRHSVEYSKTGRTMPILLVGEPGIGKTLIAQNYGKVMKLPCSFLSGPSASAGRGLSGAPNLYVGAGVGAVVQAMIDHGIGNPIVCIDEIEKATGGYSRSPDFQSELLNALDERNTSWYDNFLEMRVDASHIPYIFTANDKEQIIPPLLDRMEVIQMEKPTKEMMNGITKKFIVPNTLQYIPTGRSALRKIRWTCW